MLRPHLRAKHQLVDATHSYHDTEETLKKQRRKRKTLKFNQMLFSLGLTFLIALVVGSSFKIFGLPSSSINILSEKLRMYERNVKVEQKDGNDADATRRVMKAANKARSCTSPEVASWIMDGQCNEETYVSALENDEFQHSCGLCGDSATYLRNLRNEIKAQYEDQCKDLVVYGACLGATCEKLVTKENEWHVMERPGTCFFLLIGGMSEVALSSNVNEFSHFIIIDITKMPYKNNRRNVKVLKFSPGLLFPWADRVIWQDQKFPAKWDFQLPKDYMLHFNRTIENQGTCLSFVGLPHHESAIGVAANVTLSAQCNAIISAVEGRPSVSDSIDSVRTQCEKYMERNIRQTPLVDTAFIVYDMRSSSCRKFNGNFLCTWLDEIHCHSDRDQISFPFIIDSMDLELASGQNIPGKEYRDQVYVNAKNKPMLHVAKRSCHWYYGSFSRCVALAATQHNYLNIGLQNQQNNYQDPSFGKKRRVAVIVGGTLQRFMFNSTLEHVMKPMNNLRHPRVRVDYYVYLTTAKAKPYRSSNAYTGYFDADPIIPESRFSDHADVEEFIRDKVGSVGASVGAIFLKDKIDIDSEPLLKKRREKLIKKHPDEDPDVRFPVIDIRNKDTAYRTANANRNLLRMHLSIQYLWNQAIKWEQEEGFKYDYVMFMRDDTLWLDDFNIDHLYKKDGDIFLPSCDARPLPMEPSEINDHILVSTRKVADLFGNYYTTLNKSNTTKCMIQLPDRLAKKKGKYRRGCNSEMLLKFVLEENKINAIMLPQSELPFQRSANVNIPNMRGIQCFHKFCQSKDSPMDTKKIKNCADIDWGYLLQNTGG